MSNAWTPERHMRYAEIWMRRYRDANDAHNRERDHIREARLYGYAQKCLSYAQQHEKAANRKRAAREKGRGR